MRDKIVERTQSILKLFQMTGETRELLVLALAGEKTFKKLGRVPDLLDNLRH
jgi:hypothetical protein